MRIVSLYLLCAGLLAAYLLGLTLSVPLQAPAVALLGFAAIVAGINLLRSQKTEGKKNDETTDERRKTKEKLRDNRGEGWLLVLSLVAIFYFIGRAWLSPVWDLGVEDLMLILSAGVLYLVAGYAVIGKAGITLRQGLAWVVIVLLLLHLGSCVTQLLGGEGYSLSRHLTGAKRSSIGHITGMYGYYGSFANFSIIAGLLCLSLGVWGRMRSSLRVLLFALGVAALTAAVGSQSRSAILSLVPSLILFGFLVIVSIKYQSTVIRKWVSLLVYVIGILGVVACLFGGSLIFKDRVDDDRLSGLDLVFENNLRVNYWSMAAEQWAEKPVTGGGSRSFSYECFLNWNPNLGTFEANPEFVHNEYLQLMADYGLVGLLLILALLGWHLYRGGKQVLVLAEKVGEHGLKRGSNAMALAIAGTCGMTAMAVHICFDFRMHLLANLLLLVCCASWVLAVAKSTVLKSRSRGVRESKKGGRGVEDTVRGTPLSLTGTVIPAKGFNPGGILGVVMMVLGLGAVGLGGQQLWVGWPLIANKMAKEDGAWIPQEVDRNIWIPALEESLARAPQWRRYQRLGTLYRLEAGSLEGIEQEVVTEQAIKAYESSIKSHPYNPVSRINLAGIYASQGLWVLADQMYESASKMARAREHWFRMHSEWALMERQWAIHEWEQKKYISAENHLLSAKELFNLSFEYAKFNKWDRIWVTGYSKVLITYARLLDQQQRYDEAKLLFDEAQEQPNWHNRQAETKLNFYYAMHLYERGKYLWYQRKPEQAYQLMKNARGQLLEHKSMMGNAVEAGYEERLIEIQQVIDFLEKTGVGK